MNDELGQSILDRCLRVDAGTSEAAKQQLRAAIAAIDPPATTRWQELDVSWFPSARFGQLRFVAAHELDAAVRDRFARPCVELPELAAVFVDPEQLSYHAFENVVGLDRWFGAIARGSLRFGAPEPIAAGVRRLDLRIAGPLADALRRLDTLGLYVPPRGHWRGGRRFSFHAAALADELTAALIEAQPELRRSAFMHVNPVFRCNRFDPGDAPFAAHVDSPFSSPSRSLVSKQSLVLYLSSGTGEDVLRFADEASIAKIDAPTAFVFDHAIRHAGRPYASGPKIFVRSELVYKSRITVTVPAIGERFAKACWLDVQSLLDPELEAWANANYDRAAAAHFLGPDGLGPDGLDPDPSEREPFLHREFAGLHFVTNGYDGFFRRRDVGPIEAAAIMVLELVHAMIDGVPFRKLCGSERLIRSRHDRSWIAPFLAEFPDLAEPPLVELDDHALFPEPEAIDASMEFPGSPDLETEPYPDDWDARRHPRVVEDLRRAQRWASKRIFTAPIVMLGKQVFLDPARFVIRGDQIHVLSDVSLGPLHFAGAEFFRSDDFLGVDVELDALQPLVPPIWFHVDSDARGGLLHLRCDLFRNGWLVGQRSERVPIPYVIDGHAHPNSQPWLWATTRHHDAARLQAELEEPLE